MSSRVENTRDDKRATQRNRHVGLSSLFNVSNEKIFIIFITCVLMNNILPPFYSVQILCAEVTKEKTSEE
jgi:hypothetical protein